MTTTMTNLGKALIGVLSTVLFLVPNSTQAQTIGALGSCDGAASGSYVVKVTGLMSGNTYDIYVDGVLDPGGDDFTGDTTYTSPSQTFLDGTKSILVRVINDPIGTADTTDIIVHEVLCIDADMDGSLDFDTATCNYTMALPDIGTIVSTVHPYNGPNVYLYVLTDSAGIVLDTIENYRGHFTGLSNGEYEVHAYNFLDTTEAQAFMDSLTIGVTDLDGFNVSFPACYNWCGTASYSVSCDCLINIDAEPQDLALCMEGDGDFVVETSIGPPIPPGAVLEYQWQEDTGSGFANIADTDSILNLTNIPFADSGNMYRVIITLDVGGTDICMDTSAIATLTVWDDPVLDPNLDMIVCSDEISGIVLGVDVGSISAVSYDIVTINVNSLTPAGGNASTGITADPNVISNDSYTNTGSAQDTAIYSIAPIGPNGCVGDTVDVLLIVKPEPVYASMIINTVCSGEDIQVYLPDLADNGIAIDSYNVVLQGLPAGFSAGSANSGPTTDTAFIFTDNFTNISDVVDTVRYDVAPFADGCIGDTIRVKIAVKPEPVFASDIDVTACSDFVTNVMLPITDDSGLGITTYDVDTTYVGPGLTVVKSTVGTGMTTFDTLANDVYTNTGMTEDSVVYEITPYVDGCAGATFDIVLTITPEPVGSDPAPTVCSDEVLAINLHDLITNNLSVDSFFWQADDNVNVTGETLSQSTDTIIADALNNVSSSSKVVIYRVIPKSGDCVGDTITVTVTVDPEPVETSFELIVCSDEVSGISLPDISDNTLDIDSFTVAATVGSGLTGTATQGSGITALNALSGDVFNNITNGPDTVFYTVTPYYNGCPGNDFVITLVVRPEPVLDSPALDATICSSTSTGVTLAVTGSSVGAGTWNIVTIDSSGLNSIAGSPGTGITASSGEIADDVWVNTGGSAVTVTYSVSPISSDGCVGDTLTIQVTVNPEVLVDAGSAGGPLCSNSSLDLTSLGASITGGATGGTWTTSGDGSFNNSGDFATSTSYSPGSDDIANGTVTLTLTSFDPAGACPAVVDTVVITINDVECSQFPWKGND